MFSMGPAPLPFLPCPILPFTLPSSHQVCRDAKTFGDRPIPTPEAHGIPFHPYLWENSSSARAVRPGCRVETGNFCEWPHSCAASVGQFLFGGTFKIPFRRREMWGRCDCRWWIDVGKRTGRPSAPWASPSVGAAWRDAEARPGNVIVDKSF